MCNLKFSLFILLVAISCNVPNEKQKKALADSMAAASMDDPNMDGYIPDTLICEDLEDPDVVLRFLRENDSYADFINYDTSGILLLYGHFISPTKLSVLVLIPGGSGPPCGTGCNMVMLFSCGDTVKLLFSGRSGWFTQEEVKDLDNDGVLEISTEVDWSNSGECVNYHVVVNYKGGKENTLYDESGFDYFGCGYGDINVPFYNRGDTVGRQLTTAFTDTDNDGVFEVKEYSDYKIFNGGKTEDEVLKNVEHLYDTAIVPLKK